MRWRDAIEMARRELLRRPGRAILTMVAVALAASLLTALVAIASTGRDRVLDQITHGGALASISVEAAAPNHSQEGLDNPTPGRPLALTASALRAMRKIPGVTAVVPILKAQVIVIPPVRPPAGSRLCAAARRTPPLRRIEGKLFGGADLRGQYRRRRLIPRRVTARLAPGGQLPLGEFDDGSGRDAELPHSGGPRRRRCT